MNFLSRNIKYLRKAYGYTQSQLGDLIGNVAKSNISNWENDFNSPTLDKMIELSRIFELPIRELVRTDLEKEGFTLGLTCTPNHVHLMPDHVHLIEQKRSKNILVPIKAQAGYAESLDQERLPEELEYVHVPGVTGEARTFEIEGESMEPVLFSGDYVVSVRVEDFKDIKNDRIYIVVCRLSSIYIKYTKIKGSQMLLISENSDRFATEAVHLSDIKEVWEARIKITTNFDPVMSKEEQNRQGLRITSIEQFLSQKFPGWPPK